MCREDIPPDAREGLLIDRNMVTTPMEEQKSAWDPKPRGGRRALDKGMEGVRRGVHAGTKPMEEQQCIWNPRLKHEVQRAHKLPT